MITRVQVKNYRSLADVNLKMGPLIILVGKNGAGKSTFLDVLRFVRDSLRHGLENAILDRHGFASLRRWAPRRPYDVEIAITVERQSFWGQYSFVLASGADATYRVKRESCRVGHKVKQLLKIEDEFETKNGKWVTLPERVVKRGSRQPSLQATELALPGMAVFSPLYFKMRRSLLGSFYSIFPNTLREPQKPSTEKILTDHGDNFASVVRRLDRQKGWSPHVLNALRRVVDGVSDLHVKEVGGYLVTELKHDDLTAETTPSDNSPWFELAQESDGTIRMLAMLVALYQSAPRTLIGLEEPENALHPGALAVLSDVLREATRRHQVLITTQSPDLISRFKAEELRVVERSAGTTKIGVMDEIQRETIEEQLFSAGDLLRIEGLRRETVLAGDGHA
jgi:predicted ATPase